MTFLITFMILILVIFLKGYGLMYSLIAFIGLALFSELLTIRKILEKRHKPKITIKDLEKKLGNM